MTCKLRKLLMFRQILFARAIRNVKPLTPRSNQHLNSPYNITTESHVNVMRIKEMITN